MLDVFNVGLKRAILVYIYINYFLIIILVLFIYVHAVLSPNFVKYLLLLWPCCNVCFAVFVYLVDIKWLYLEKHVKRSSHRVSWTRLDIFMLSSHLLQRVWFEFGPN